MYIDDNHLHVLGALYLSPINSSFFSVKTVCGEKLNTLSIFNIVPYNIAAYPPAEHPNAITFLYLPVFINVSIKSIVLLKLFVVFLNPVI